jgi:hypothetical protein
MASQPFKDLEKQREYQVEDVSTRVHSQLQEVERRLIRGCVKRGMTAETRRQMAFMLKDAAAQIEKFPLMDGEE